MISAREVFEACQKSEEERQQKLLANEQRIDEIIADYAVELSELWNLMVEHSGYEDVVLYRHGATQTILDDANYFNKELKRAMNIVDMQWYQVWVKLLKRAIKYFNIYQPTHFAEYRGINASGPVMIRAIQKKKRTIWRKLIHWRWRQ